MPLTVDHPLLTFAFVLAGGFAAGLLLQMIAVFCGVQRHSRQGYVIAGLIGIGGAIAGIPVSALLDYARGGPGELSGELVPSVSVTMAIVSVFYWILLRNLNRIGRRAVIAGVIFSAALLVLMIAAT